MDITRTRAAQIIAYGGSRPEGISEARWNAIVKQVANNELKG